MGMISRIKKRRAAKNPKQQYYGGSKENYERSQKKNQRGVDAGNNRVNEQLQRLGEERDTAGARNQGLDAMANMDSTTQRNEGTLRGLDADASMGDYRAGRGALLADADNISGRAAGIDANAASMEQIARDAPGNYQSAADAAFRGASERNQRNALALAAGRGAGSVRTALATAGANNAQAALDQQVTRAQEANALLGLQGQLLQGAAGVRGQAAGVVGQGAQVRSSVAGQDQQAAQIQAQRQQAAVGANLQAQNLRAGLAQTDAATGANAAGTAVNAGAGQRDAYLAAQGGMEAAQLGQNAAYEQQRLANAKTKGPFQKVGSIVFDPMNFRGSEAGGLGNVW